jgi:hypothetical protein
VSGVEGAEREDYDDGEAGVGGLPASGGRIPNDSLGVSCGSMSELVLSIVELLLEAAAERLMIQFCNLSILCWHQLQSIFGQIF